MVIDCAFKIKKIQINNNAFCLLTSDRRLFIHGKDIGKSRSLGLGPDVTKTSCLTEIIIESEQITDFSLSEKHGCAITEKGNTYVWGRGYSGETGQVGFSTLDSPKKLDCLDYEEFKLVFCNKYATFLLSDTGALLMGRLGGASSITTLNLSNNSTTSKQKIYMQLQEVQKALILETS